MGKQLRRQGSDIEYQPSCFGVLIQILDHHHHNHHRTNGKDMIQQNKRRGRGRKRAICKQFLTYGVVLLGDR